MKKKKNKLLYGILLFLTLFASIRPQIFDQIAISKYFYTAVLAIATISSVLLYVKNLRKFKFTSIVLLYLMALLIPTLLFQLSATNLLFFFKTHISVFSIVALTEYAFVKKEKKTFFWTISLFFLIIVGLNVLFIAMFGPNYIGHRSAFLGYDNTVLPFIIFGSITSYMAPKIIKDSGKLKAISFVNMLLLILNCLMVESSNAKIAAVMIVSLLIIDRTGLLEKKRISKHLNLKTYVVFSLILFLAIVVFRMQYLFEDIIVNDLHRSISITGRTAIWDSAIETIKENPLIGVGVEDFSVRAYVDGQIFHAHSTYLNILYECGIVGIIAYLNIFRKTWQRIKSFIQSKEVAILSFSVLIYFIITLVEYYKNSHTFFMMLAVLFYLPVLKMNHTSNGKATEKDE